MVFDSSAGDTLILTPVQEQLATPAARRYWAESAEMEAVTGSCPGSLRSVRSGIRLWAKYAVGFLGLQRPYPAPVWALV